jgi:holliday junction DNA helicase RuvA
LIERLEGDLVEVGPEHILINIGGIGIRVNVARTVADRLQAGGRAVILPRLIIRDGDPQLFGFLASDERSCFDALISVTGVGPRIGLAVLSHMDPHRIALEVERGSPEQLLIVPGIGRKLASRILLEVKGRLSFGPPEDLAGMPEVPSDSDLSREAVRALTALGYPLAESREAVRLALTDIAEESPSLDRILRAALTGLSRARS